MFYHSIKENNNRNSNYINISSFPATKVINNNNDSSNKMDNNKKDVILGHKKLNSEIPNKNDKVKKSAQNLNKTNSLLYKINTFNQKKKKNSIINKPMNASNKPKENLSKSVLEESTKKIKENNKTNSINTKQPIQNENKNRESRRWK